MTIQPAPGGFDAASFRAFCARLGIDTQAVTNPDGTPDVRLDRAGLEQLRDAASAHGATAIAAAIDVALAELPSEGGAS